MGKKYIYLYYSDINCIYEKRKHVKYLEILFISEIKVTHSILDT